MQSKSLLIAIAAFAVTTTGVHAYAGTSILNRSGLSEEQKSAIVIAHELRETGDIVGARDVLVEAGIDEAALLSIRAARHAAMGEMHQALEDGDYEAFQQAIATSPLADIITSKEDFEQFREAHALRQEGEWGDAADLFIALGVEPQGRHGHELRGMQRLSELSEGQRAAYSVATQANDRETQQAILDEAGVAWPPRGAHQQVE